MSHGRSHSRPAGVLVHLPSTGNADDAIADRVEAMQNIQNASDMAAVAPAALGSDDGSDGLVRVRGADDNNLRSVDVAVPRDASSHSRFPG